MGMHITPKPGGNKETGMRPSASDFLEYVKKFPKNVGMRQLYKDFWIKSPKRREKFRQLWDMAEEVLKNAGGNKSSEVCGKVDEPRKVEGDGDSNVPSIDKAELPDGKTSSEEE